MDDIVLNQARKLSMDEPELLGWTMPGLDRRAIIVTGAGSGIGAAVARAFSAAGSRVLGVDRDEEGLQATLNATNGAIHVLAADLVQAESPQQIVDEAVKVLGELTTIVNIAGVSRWNYSPDVTREHLQFQVDVNVFAPFFLTQAALPHLKQSQGQVVFCGSSISAYLGSAGAVGYDISKHALLGMMRSVAAELAPQGVRVNSISPGTTVSPINDSLFERDGWLDKTVARIPDGRIAEPHEHVGAVAYLVSDLAKHVHGHDIVVDGGRLAVG